MAPISRIKYLIRQIKIKSILKKNRVSTGGRFYIEYIENIVFGGDIYIGPEAFWSAKGGIEIGKNVIFGPKSTIWTYNHNYKSIEMFPYAKNDILGKVVIKDDVWIGLGALVMPGVTVNEGAIVGAGAVVVKDVPRCAIVAGNPAKTVGTRDESAYAKINDAKRYMISKNA
jgi:acetyltransferase-like isoleucine patch superfamily enzyme